MGLTKQKAHIKKANGARRAAATKRKMEREEELKMSRAKRRKSDPKDKIVTPSCITTIERPIVPLTASQMYFANLRQPKSEDTDNVDVKIKMDFEETAVTIVKVEEPPDVEVVYSDGKEEDQEMIPISENIYIGKRTRSRKMRKTLKPKTELPPLRPRPHLPSPSFCFVCVLPLADTRIHPTVTSADCFCLVRDLLEMSTSQTQHYMDEMKEPEKLIGLCDKCHHVIREAAELKAHITKLEITLKKCQRKILEKIKDTTLTPNSNTGTCHERPKGTGNREQRAAVAKILKYVHNRKYRPLALREKRVNRAPSSQKKIRRRPCKKAKNETPTAPSKKFTHLRNKKNLLPPKTDPIMLQTLVASLPPAPQTSSVFLPKKKGKFNRGNKMRAVNKGQNLYKKSVARHTPSPTLGGLSSSNSLRLPPSGDISIIENQDIENDDMPAKLFNDTLSVEDEVEVAFFPGRKHETIVILPNQPIFTPQPESQILQLQDDNSMDANGEQFQLGTNQMHPNWMSIHPSGPSQNNSKRIPTSNNFVDLRKILGVTPYSRDKDDSRNRNHLQNSTAT